MAYRMIFQEQLGVKERVHSIINASVFIVYLCTWPPDFSLHQLPLPVSGRSFFMFSTRKSPQHTPFGTRSNCQGGWVGCMGFCQLPIAHLSHPNLGFCKYITLTESLVPFELWEADSASGIGIWNPFQINVFISKCSPEPITWGQSVHPLPNLKLGGKENSKAPQE